MVTEIQAYIKDWEKRCYYNGIPDIAPLELEQRKIVPSYHRIALALLKNDHTLKTLGFDQKKSKYYSMLKQIELIKRGKISIQLKLF